MNGIKETTLPELLSPAGSAEAFEAALSAGADAVYFGALRFSARARAKNLDDGEYAEMLKECRARGVKAYGAVNTRLRDAELPEAVECAYSLLAAGVDALIVADAGLVKVLRATFPEAELHASTQFTGTGVADARALASMGLSRMVCPRELSLGELRTLCESSPIPIEMFVHGAHCVSVSGQCMLSAVMGGRSGNRGDCAGPCRLPFDAGLGTAAPGKGASGHALSLKDMCLAAHIEEILTLGVASLKIEGRLKNKEYVYGTTSVYRRLLDERRNATPDEVRELARLFSRDGFTDGYLKRTYRSMSGRRDDGERRDAVKLDIPAPAKVPVDGSIRLAANEHAVLTLHSSVTGSTVTVTGEDVLSPAQGNPPTAESVTRSIAKLGSTPFMLESLAVDTDGVCGIAASALNALRREAAEALLAPAPVKRAEYIPEKTAGTPAGKNVRAAVLTCAAQNTDAVREYFDEVYLPFDDFEGDSTGACLSLPPVTYDPTESEVKRSLALAKERGVRALVHTPGQLLLAREAGVTAVASHRFVVFNGTTADVLLSLGAESVCVSPELPAAAVREVTAHGERNASLITGGRLPLMLTRRCPMSDGGEKCPLGRDGGTSFTPKDKICRGYLRDRTGAILPAVGDRRCSVSIYNSVPTYADAATVARTGVSRTFYVFSTESPREADEAVRNLRAGTAPKEYRKLK